MTQFVLIIDLELLGSFGVLVVLAHGRLVLLLVFIVLLVLPLIASLPLFLLGMDWGRWLSLLAITALMPMLSNRLRPALYDCLPSALRTSVDHSIAPLVARALNALRRTIERHPIRSCAAMFCLPVPPLPLWWAVFVLNPPVIVLKFLFHFWIK